MSGERDFDRAMRQLYLDARDAGYNATYFVRMLNELGGVLTAKRLVGSTQPSDGFTRLWEMDRLELSVEALVLDAKWRTLFSDIERGAARRRLMEYGWRDESRQSHKGV